MRITIAIFFLAFVSDALAADPKYPVSAIPEDMIQGMYAVVRESDIRFYIESKNQSSYYKRKVVTILNAKAKDEAEIAIFYDKLTRIENFKANVYDAQGNLIKKLKQSDVTDQSAISGISLFEDNRVKYADLSQTTFPYTVEYEYTVTQRFLYSIPGYTSYRDDEISTQSESFSVVYPIGLKPRYKLFKIGEPKFVAMADKRESMTWTFQNIKPVKFERLSPQLDRVVPNIKLAPAEFEYEGYAGNMSTWEQYGNWQALLNKGVTFCQNPQSKRCKS
jgi:hypothetical protein